MRPLVAAIEHLEATFAESAQLADSAENRVRSVRLRKVISEQVVVVGACGEGAFSDEKHRYAFRDEYGLMRSAIARHYAAWPISAINLDDNDYIGSIKQMRLACNRFFGWVRTALAIEDAK